MANPRALAAVSTTLRTLLADRMDDPVAVTIAPPDITVDGTAGTRRVNLYLYQVSENGSLRNMDLNAPNGAYGNPPLSLDLHYLITAYGASDTAADADLDAQGILGDTMRVLHDVAIVTPDTQRVRAVGTILAPELQNEFENVRITLRNSSLEELSKIWTALPQANFRRSVAYQVSVVQIESGKPRRVSAPVQQRKLTVGIMERPRITAVYRTPGPTTADGRGDVRVHVGDSLTIDGVNFRSDQTFVRFGELAPVAVTPQSDTRILVNVPNDPNLGAGIRMVEVLTEGTADAITGAFGTGVTTTEPMRFTSNQFGFILLPTVTNTVPLQGTAADLLTVNGQKLWHDGASALVLVGNVGIEIRPPAAGDPWAAPTANSVQVPLTRLATALPTPPPGGTLHPVRVIVDGAQSTETGIDFRLLP